MLFAYGLSGSGKTFTVFGVSLVQNPAFGPDSVPHFPLGAQPDAMDSPEAWFKFTTAPSKSWGIFPRIAWELFQRKQDGWEISMRYFQNIVNDVRDLNSPMGAEKHYNVGLHKDDQGFMQFDWVSSVPLYSFEELCAAVQSANSKKAISATQFNHQSTRGHCILQLEITKPHDEVPSQLVKCRLYVCDLAGTEPAANIYAAEYARVVLPDGSPEYRLRGPSSDAGKTKELQSQGKKINLSLSEMAQFFMKMAQAFKAKKLEAGATIPGCNSYFLCKYLKGTMLHAKTWLFCAIRPEVQFHTYTYATLGFAKNASVVKLKPKKGLVSSSPREEQLVMERDELARQVEALRAENAKLRQRISDGPANEDGVAEMAAPAEGRTRSATDDFASALSAQEAGEGKIVEPANNTRSRSASATERSDYEERGIFLNQFAEQQGTAEQPHFVNLDEDSFRSERFLYVLSRTTNVFGQNSGDIRPYSVGVVEDHCTVERTDESFFLVAGKGNTYHNGKLLTEQERVEISCYDRVVMGTEMMLFIVPGKEPEHVPRPTAGEAKEEFHRASHRRRSSLLDASNLSMLASTSKSASHGNVASTVLEGDGGLSEEEDSEDDEPTLEVGTADSPVQALEERKADFPVQTANPIVEDDWLGSMDELKEALETCIDEARQLLETLDFEDDIRIELAEIELQGAKEFKARVSHKVANVSVLLDTDDIDDVVATLEGELSLIRDAYQHHEHYKVPRDHHPVAILFDSRCPLIGTSEIGKIISSMVKDMHVTETEQWCPVISLAPPYGMFGKLLVKVAIEVHEPEGQAGQGQPREISESSLLGKTITVHVSIREVDSLPFAAHMCYCQYDIFEEAFISDLDAMEGIISSGPILFNHEAEYLVPSVTETFFDDVREKITIELHASPVIGQSEDEDMNLVNREISTSDHLLASKLGFEGRAVRDRRVSQELREMEDITRSSLWTEPVDKSSSGSLRSIFSSFKRKEPAQLSGQASDDLTHAHKFESVLLVSILAGKQLPIVPDHR